MRTKPYIITILAVSLLGPKVAIAQTEPLPPLEIQSTPLPSPDPPPILPSQQETIRQLIETEIEESQAISDRIDAEVGGTFGLTLNLLNLLIAMLIAIPIATGFVLWWLRQSVIDRLVRDVSKQFQQETDRLIKQQLEDTVTAKLQTQVETFELELKQLRLEFEQRLNSLYQDAETNKDKIVAELAHLVASVGQADTAPISIERRLKQLTDQLEQIKAGNQAVSFSALDYLKAGDAFYLGRNYTEAIASYQAALDLDSSSIEAQRGIAKTLRRLGQYDEAIAANEDIIRRQPQNAWAWFGKGAALADLHQYDAALNAYERVLHLEPNQKTFWKHKGYVLTKLQRFDEAIDCFEKALHLDPDSSGTYYWKAACYAAQHQAEAAIEHLKIAIQRRPDFQHQLSTDPDFDSIRQTDSFQQFCANPF